MYFKKSILVSVLKKKKKKKIARWNVNNYIIVFTSQQILNIRFRGIYASPALGFSWLVGSSTKIKTGNGEPMVIGFPTKL